jgi:hypothetical protein
MTEMVVETSTATDCSARVAAEIWVRISMQ